MNSARFVKQPNSKNDACRCEARHRRRRAIKNENRALHLVPVPYDRRLQDLYLPTTLSGEFLADTGTIVSDDLARRDALFRQFLEWQKRRR
jgi:hypothetical protein